MYKKIFILTGIIFFVGLILWTTPQTKSEGTIKIYDRNKSLLFELAGNTGRNETVEFDLFPDHLQKAIIAAEDESFYSHGGVDIKAIARSFIVNIKSGKIVSGASTITQQVGRLNAKPLSDNLISRIIGKIRESLIAVRLSLTYSKKDILSIYLNEVYLGNHNYGFQSAASFYFHKNVEKLSLNESAYLAGMIASPSKYDPYIHPQEGNNRKAYVLKRMGANGFITKEQMDTAVSIPCEFTQPESNMIAPHFVDYIISLIPSLHVPTHNISIYTTLDIPTYKLSHQIATYWVKKVEKSHNAHNAAMIVLDNSSGAIISMLGGINYFDAKQDGQVNIALSPRQPGSAIKPITYTAAFLKDITPATLIYDVKTSYPTKKGEGFIPNNFGDKYHGLVLAREALASSYNLPAVEILHRIGLDTFLNTAKALGINTFTNTASYDYSITLGANEVSLLELTNAYATIDRGGMYLEPYAISKITDEKNRTVYTHPKKNPVQRLGPRGPKATYLVTDILSDPLARMPGFGEKNYLTLSRPAAVKTGTTTDWHDIWTIGYTPSYTVGVWMGNNNNDEMHNISSAEGVAPVWNQFLEEFLKDKKNEEFTKPDGIVKKEICSLSGQLYDSLCPERKQEIFIKGTEPKKKSTLHKTTRIDSRNGLLASYSCPPSVVVNKLLVDYPPEVYSWAFSNNKPYVPHEFSPLCKAPSEKKEEAELTISITNPKNKAVYQNAPYLIRNQAIPLDVNVSSNIISVSWYVDKVKVGESSIPPFSILLQLRRGNHMVYAEGRSKSKTVKSLPISFSVIDFK